MRQTPFGWYAETVLAKNERELFLLVGEIKNDLRSFRSTFRTREEQIKHRKFLGELAVLGRTLSAANNLVKLLR